MNRFISEDLPCFGAVYLLPFSIDKFENDRFPGCVHHEKMGVERVLVEVERNARLDQLDGFVDILAAIEHQSYEIWHVGQGFPRCRIDRLVSNSRDAHHETVFVHSIEGVEGCEKEVLADLGLGEVKEVDDYSVVENDPEGPGFRITSSGSSESGEISNVATQQ